MGYTRREVIGQALLAGAGATIAGALPSGTALAAADGGPDSPFDPSFLSGQIISMQSSGRLTVLEDEDRVRSAQLRGGSGIWKQAAWGGDPGLGDCLYATGVLGRDGVFGIDQMWIAIGTFLAKAVDVQDGLVTLDTDGQTIESRIIARTQIQDRQGRLTNARPTSLLRDGDYMQVVGFSDPKTGAFTASLIYPLVSDNAASALELQPTKGMPRTISGPNGPLIQCPLTWYGLATFFCCGGVNGCNYNKCGGSGGGWCVNQTCRSYNHQMAWKNVSEPGNTCNATCFSCCDTTMSQFACGTFATVTNPCQSKSDSPYIVDCGPNLHCVSAFGCQNRTVVKFDLTPCSFAAIGGSFNAGMVTCDTTLYIQC